MASRKEKSAANPVAKKPKVETPFARFFARLDAMPNAVGRVMIRGVPSGSSGDEEDEDEPADVRNARYTDEDMAHTRWILVDEGRARALDDANDALLGEQAGDGFLMFNTSFSYQVLEEFVDLAADLPDAEPAARFDKLLGFTRAIHNHDVWMHDHESGWGGPKMLKKLAKLWKSTLAETDSTLRIDAEFTRPGVECFLDEFKEAVEDIDADYDDCPRVKFAWQ